MRVQTARWGDVGAFKAERQARVAIAVPVLEEGPPADTPAGARVISFPGAKAAPDNPLLALYSAMSDEARVDLLAYARGRLRRDRARRG